MSSTTPRSPSLSGRGNRRADGYLNIVANPHAGLNFLIPGRGETLRINGRAHLVSDAAYFDEMVVKGHRPVLAVVVEIEQIFFHCAKAFLRSKLWKPESWNPDVLPPHPVLIKELQDIPETLEQLQAHYGPSYEANLYQQVKKVLRPADKRRRIAEEIDASLRLEGLARSEAARMINDRYVNGDIDVDEMVRQTIALHSHEASPE